jgi:hypothetical protein
MAQDIANAIAAEFGVPPPPPIFVSNQLSKVYAGAYYDRRMIHDNPDAQHIVIRPEYFSDRTIAHETGHYVYHMRNPGVCNGGSRECEAVACMIEAWWVDRQKTAGLLSEDWK